MTGQIVKFVFVGGVATSFNFLVLVLLVEVFAAPKVVSSAVAYMSGGFCSYIMNYYLTFGSSKKHLETIPKFVIVVMLGSLVNTTVFALTNIVIDMYFLSQCFAVGVALICNFLLHKYWIYLGE